MTTADYSVKEGKDSKLINELSKINNINDDYNYTSNETDNQNYIINTNDYNPIYDNDINNNINSNNMDALKYKKYNLYEIRKELNNENNIYNNCTTNNNNILLHNLM